MHQQQTALGNIMGTEEIARNEQFLLFPLCFLLNQIIVSPFFHIFDVISLFAAELEEPKIGISGKGINLLFWPLATIFCQFVFYSFLAAGALIHDALSKLYTNAKRNEIADQIRELLTDENAPEKVHLISQYLELMDTDVEAEHRYENEDWFEGVLRERFDSF